MAETIYTGQLTKAEKEDLSKALKEVNFNDPKDRYALAETIVTQITDSVRETDLVQLICDVETFELGQSMQYSVTKGVKAYVHEPGSYAPRSQVVKKTLNLYSEQTSINLELNILELKAGRYGSVADLKRQVKNEMYGCRNAAVWNIFKAAITSADTSQYFTFGSSDNAATKKIQLDAALAYVYDHSAAPKAIIGRYTALNWISDITGYSDKYAEMRDRAGLLGEYHGVPIVYLPIYVDGWGVERISNADIFVVADGCGKFGIQLDNFMLENIEADALTWNIHLTEIWGAAVCWSERCARINIS
jgi:hypothetical protein